MLGQTSPVDWVLPLSELGKTGLLGVLLTLSIWAIIKLYKDGNIERASHLEDTKAMTLLIKDSTQATVNWTNSQNERNKALEDMASALNRLTALVQK